MVTAIIVLIALPILLLFMGIGGWILKGLGAIISIWWDGFDNCLSCLLTPIIILFLIALALAII